MSRSESSFDVSSLASGGTMNSLGLQEKEENYGRLVADELGRNRPQVKDVVIIRNRDKYVRFSTNATALSSYDIHNVVSAFADGQQARMRGINIQGRDYEAIRADDYSVYAKRDKHGILCTKTPESIVIATYDEKMVPSIAVELLERLGDIIRRIEIQFAR